MPNSVMSKPRIKYLSSLEMAMAKKNEGGFQSSAGLMRYFDTENDKGIKVGPKTVVGIAIGLAAIVILLNTLVPL